MMGSSRKHTEYFHRSFQIAHKGNCKNYTPIYNVQEHLVTNNIANTEYFQSYTLVDLISK